MCESAKIDEKKWLKEANSLLKNIMENKYET
jgi:hypothetical protein